MDINYGLIEIENTSGKNPDEGYSFKDAAERRYNQIWDYALSRFDERAKERTALRFGDVPNPGDPETGERTAGYALAELHGISDNPERWWTARGREIPAGMADKYDLYREIGREFMEQNKSAYDKQKAEHDAKQKAMTAGFDRYVAGDAIGGEGLTEQLTAEMMQAVGEERAQKMQDVRGFMEQYVRPLEDSMTRGEISFQEMLRRLDGLDRELLDATGDDKETVEMAVYALMNWAKRMSETNGMDAADEFMVAFGRQISNWANVLKDDERAAKSPADVLAWEISGRERTMRARGVLRNAIDQAIEFSDTEAWYNKLTRLPAQMLGSTLPYINPWSWEAGLAVGTINTLGGGQYEATTKGLGSGMSMQEANTKAWQQTGIQSVVEAIPFGLLGGPGANKMIAWATRGGVKPGTIAARLHGYSTRSVWHALALEAGAGFIEEGVLEPIASGLLEWGSDHALDLVGMPHGGTESFRECFRELSDTWTDPYQLAGLAIFSAGLAGSNLPRVKAAMAEMVKNRNAWKAMGLNNAEVDLVMGAEKPIDKGREIIAAGWADDPAGMAERVKAANKEMAANGNVLFLTGTQGLEREVDAAAAAVWQDAEKRGWLPHIEKDGENYRITKAAKNGENAVELTLTPEQADIYLKQEMQTASARLTRELTTLTGRIKRVDIRESISNALARIGGNAAIRELQEKGEAQGILYEDVLEYLPADIAEPIRMKGAIGYADAQKISEYAAGQIEVLVNGGMDEKEARSKVGIMGGLRSLGTWAEFARDFAARAEGAGIAKEEAYTNINRSAAGYRTIDGKEVMAQAILGVGGGRITTYGALEDVTEAFADRMLDERARELEKADGVSYEQGRAQALREMHDIVKRAREAVLKADPNAQIEAVGETPDYMQVVEALSTMAVSQFATSDYVPKWMKSLASALRGNLQAAGDIEAVRAAYANVLRDNPEAIKGLDEILSKLGVQVRGIFSEARMTAADVTTWAKSAYAEDLRAEMSGNEARPAAEAVSTAEETERKIIEEDAAPKAAEEAPKTPSELSREFSDTLAKEPAAETPENMQGVFTGGCVYNAAGDYYCGLIDKNKLQDGTEQVKVGARGKHGVIAGRELTGNFQASAAPLFVWKRRDGSLRVISGRHRFELMMRDEACQAHLCYVFEENDVHTEKWARMMDYENNMRDDQADELTAATYVRETGYSDDVLREKGLMRNESRSKRGALIGRVAREELWVRFKNGAINAKDAEIVCNMTKNIRHEERIEEIQRRCCMLLEKGKGWDYIGAMCQLMANKESVFMKQGLLDFGADFEQDLDRAAKYVELNLSQLNAAIRRMKQGAKLGEKERAQAMRLGIDVSMSEGSEQLLQLLNDMKAKFEYIGSHPDLVASASMWDGKTDPDPVGQMIERAKREREAAEAENEMTDEEWMEQKAREEAAAMTPSLFAMERRPEERNLAAVHSLNPEKFLAAVELGGMPMPSVAITRLDRPYEWGGASAINLIGRPEMVDPKKGTEVYGADAWTGKFPRIIHKHIESEDFKEAAKAAGEMEDQYGYVFYDLAGKLRNADTREDLRTLLSYDTGKALFAYLQGYRPKAKTAEKNRDYDFLDKQFVKDTKGMWENGESIKPGQEAAFADAVEASLERWLKGKSDKERKLYEGLYSELIDDLRNGRPYGVWFKLKMSMNNMGKREPDAHANREMLAKYADRHKKEFAAWVKDKVDKWRSKEAYIRENGKEATLDNVVRLMLGKKGLNNEEFMGFNPGKLRAGLAAKMKSLDDIRARREKLSGSQESKESKAASEELMMEYCRYVREYLNNAGADSFNSIDYGLESLSLVKGKPTEEKVARAIDKVFSYTKAGEAMSKDSNMLKKGVEAIEAIRNEIEDYMEAVPQRAVNMSEWEYAVLPKGLKKNKEVTDALKANGIQPIWHDGTEEGRKAALAGLVNEPTVSFQMNKYSNAERYMREAWAGDPRARLSGTSYAMEKNLAAVHSLNPEKFLAAVELGGMPMPSVAITRLDRPYEWGGAGAINLIGKPEMVDPKKRSKVYMHDAYTGTMPPVKYKRKNAAAAERLKQDALEKLAVYGMGESDGLRRGIFSEDEEVMDGDAADWGYNRAMMAYWAITQAGYAPKPKMTDKPGQMSKDKHAALKPWVAKLKKKDMKPEDFTAEELEAFRGVMVAYYEGKKLRGSAKEYREMEAWRLARCAREEADKVRNYSTAKVPDGLENGTRFAEYVKKHAKAYSAWCKAETQKYLGDQVFQRKYERRNWRGDVVDEWWGHEKYTLGNVLKYLRENKARGEEMNSITPGVFLAGVAEEMRNMREIGWARERVVGAEEYKKAKDEYEEAFSAFYDKACEIGREAGGGYFDLADAAMYNLLELVQGGKRMPAREAVQRALEQSGGKWTEESVDAAMHLLEKALGMPSDYMEAVPQRAVNMSEWEYAVLPKGLKKNKDVTDALKANGIQPIWHDGTEEGRREALASLVGDTAVSFAMERIEDVQDRWNNTLDEHLKNSNTTGSSEHTHDIVVCPTPAVMRMVGAKGLNMVITPAVLSKVMHRKHSVTIDALRQLPSAMAAPICITESNKEGCIEVITELYEIVKGENKNILVAVQLERNSSYSDGVKVNRIASLYGKNKIKALLGHRMLYMDAEKVIPWIKNYGIDEEKVRITSDSHGLQLSERVSDMRTYSDNIKGPDDLVKYKKQENTTFSMTRGAEDALEILRKRETEREGERLIREWQKQCELWSRLGGTDDAKIGKGSRIFGEMMALVSATKGVLPPEYTRMRGLGMSLQWAEIYADMANKGEVPMRGVMKGSIYDKFVSAIEKRKEKDLLNGLTAEDAAENLKELAGRKLENIMQTVAETCRRHLESYLKNRERVRLEKVAGAAMPKEEPGKKTPRGKVAADIVRQVRNALELMDKERNEIADEIDAAKEGLNRLDPDDPEYSAKEEMLQEQAYMAKTFGNWEGMTLEEARAAADAMAQIVSNGRAAWKEKLDRERRHIKYIIGRVSRNFRVPLEEYQGAGAMRDIAEKSRGGKMLGKLPLNLMSFADLMLALRPVLGREFCDAQRAKLAEHHIRMQAFGNKLRKRMRDTAARITGMSNERDLAGWINGLNQEEHTGIHRREKVEHSVVLTIEDAQRWLDMSELQRTAERERLKREAEDAELAPPTDIPTEEHIGLLQEELAKWQAKDEDARAKQKYLKATVESTRDMGEIVATKEGILYNLLLLEQDDYAHLAEVNGLDAEAIDALKEYIGPKVMEWGYAMREMLQEQGKVLGRYYEEWTGCPFPSNPLYFPGAFDMSGRRNADEKPDQQEGMGGSISGGKMGCLIKRRRHNSRLDWLISATQVFRNAMHEQQNYISVSEMTREWRSMLADREFARRLKAEVGADVLGKLNAWVDMLDGALLTDGRWNRTMARILRPILSCYALSRLAGNVYTWIKQASGVVHGFIGGYVPDRVIENGQLVRNLSTRHIGFGEFIGSFAKCLTRQNTITLEEVRNSKWIKERDERAGRTFERATMLAPGKKVAGRAGRLAEAFTDAAMDRMEDIDRNANAVSMLALVNAVYDRAMAENKDGLVPEAQIREMALKVGGMMIDLAAQPKLRTQKSFWGASNTLGGVISNFLMLFKTESLNKAGLILSQLLSGEKRYAIGSMLTFGLANTLILYAINWVRGYGFLPGDDDDEWWQTAAHVGYNVTLADFTAVPVIGEGLDLAKSKLLGVKHYANTVSDMVLPIEEFYNAGKREARNVRKGASWDKHVQAITQLARAAGASGGVLDLAGCPTLSALTVAASTASNYARVVKDVVKKGEEMLEGD